MQKSVLNSPRLLELKRKRRKVLVKKILFWLLLFVFFIIAFSFLSKWKEININEIKISGNKIVESKQIEDIVKEEISGNYFWIFPKTNFLIYPQAKIQEELKNKLKRIKEIFISNKNIKTLEIAISEYEPKYLWCGETLTVEVENSDLNSNPKCYFLDQDGYIFDEAPYFSGEIYFKFYGTVNEINLEDINPVGSYFYQSIFTKLVLFKNNLEKIGIKPAMFFVQDNGDIEVYLSSPVKSQMGPKVIFKSDAELEQVIENLQSVLTTEPLQTEFKTKYSSLLYIDLRFGNKVYYKFK